jgi:hypothetical protein
MAFHDINQSLPEASSRDHSPIAFKLDVHLDLTSDYVGSAIYLSERRALRCEEAKKPPVPQFRNSRFCSETITFGGRTCSTFM